MAEKAIYVQHEIVTDVSHPIKGLSWLWLSEFVSPCAGHCSLGQTLAGCYFAHERMIAGCLAK